MLGPSFAGRRAEPRIARRQVGPPLDVSDIRQEHRLAILKTNHQRCDIIRVGEERSRSHRRVAILADAIACLHDYVGRFERAGQGVDGEAIRRKPGRVELDHDGAIWGTNRVHVAGARNALELGLQRMRHFGEFSRTSLRIVRPQRQRHHRNIFDAHRPYQRRAYAQARRNEILVLINLIVETHHRRLSRHADFELDRNDRHARAADGIDVLDVLYLGELLFERKRDQVFHIVHIGARERHEHVRHRHIDLRFLFARCHQHGEEPEQERHQRQNRRQR